MHLYGSTGTGAPPPPRGPPGKTVGRWALVGAAMLCVIACTVLLVSSPSSSTVEMEGDVGAGSNSKENAVLMDASTIVPSKERLAEMEVLSPLPIFLFAPSPDLEEGTGQKKNSLQTTGLGILCGLSATVQCIQRLLDPLELPPPRRSRETSRLTPRALAPAVAATTLPRSRRRSWTT